MYEVIDGLTDDRSEQSFSVLQIIDWLPEAYDENPSAGELGDRWVSDHITVSCNQSFAVITTLSFQLQFVAATLPLSQTTFAYNKRYI